jgi:hypothetical protein
MNGVPLIVIAKNLGHRDTRMVEHHYGHLAPSYVAEAIHAGAPRFGIATPTSVVPLHASKSRRKVKNDDRPLHLSRHSTYTRKRDRA